MRARASRHPARLAAVCMAGILSSGCGSDGPTQPSGPPPPVPTGRAFLSIASQDLECGAKTPVWGFFGPGAMAGAIVTADGNGWVTRPDSARSGDFEIRFRLEGSGNPLGALITGTMRGSVIDLLSSLQFPNPTRVSVSGASGEDAALSGSTFPQLSGVAATVSGTLAYTDNQGGVTTCRTGMLSLFTADR